MIIFYLTFAGLCLHHLRYCKQQAFVDGSIFQLYCQRKQISLQMLEMITYIFFM